MENVSFRKAPVVELIAELRWAPPGAAPAAGQITIAFGAAHDEFYQRFGNEVSKAGFTKAERLIPSGVPAVWHQVVWRFRKPNDNSALLQVGPGIFSANALQPYKRWKEFRPTVELGVAALFATRSTDERDLSFSNASLRYINAFAGDLLGGATPSDFIGKSLGLNVKLPAAVSKLVAPGVEVNATVNVLIPIANNTKVMSLVIGDGAVNANPAAMFDVTVAEKQPVAPQLPTVLAAFNTSRDVIHNCFVELTEHLHAKMQPEG